MKLENVKPDIDPYTFQPIIRFSGYVTLELINDMSSVLCLDVHSEIGKIFEQQLKEGMKGQSFSQFTPTVDECNPNKEGEAFVLHLETVLGLPHKKLSDMDDDSVYEYLTSLYGMYHENRKKK